MSVQRYTVTVREQASIHIAEVQEARPGELARPILASATGPSRDEALARAVREAFPGEDER